MVSYLTVLKRLQKEPGEGDNTEGHRDFLFTEIVSESALWFTILIFYVKQLRMFEKENKKITTKRKKYYLKKMLSMTTPRHELRHVAFYFISSHTVSVYCEPGTTSNSRPVLFHRNRRQPPT